MDATGVKRCRSNGPRTDANDQKLVSPDFPDNKCGNTNCHYPEHPLLLAEILASVLPLVLRDL